MSVLRYGDLVHIKNIATSWLTVVGSSGQWIVQHADQSSSTPLVFRIMDGSGASYNAPIKHGDEVIFQTQVGNNVVYLSVSEQTNSCGKIVLSVPTQGSNALWKILSVDGKNNIKNKDNVAIWSVPEKTHLWLSDHKSCHGQVMSDFTIDKKYHSGKKHGDIFRMVQLPPSPLFPTPQPLYVPAQNLIPQPQQLYFQTHKLIPEHHKRHKLPKPVPVYQPSIPLQRPLTPLQTPSTPLQTSLTPLQTPSTPIYPGILPLETPSTPLVTELCEKCSFWEKCENGQCISKVKIEYIVIGAIVAIIFLAFIFSA